MKQTFVSLLLLTGVSCVSAEEQVLRWDYDMGRYPTATFILSLVSMRNGHPWQEVRPIASLSPARCASLPDVSPTPPGTLCALLCLDAGDYSVGLTAHVGGQTSPPSVVLDADVTNPTPCTPIPPPPVTPVAIPTPKPKPVPIPVPVPVVPLPGPPVPSLVNMMNKHCVSWKILGPCLCGPTTPCLQIEYFEPAYLIETVKRPGTSVVPVLGNVVKSVLSAIGGPTLGGGGAGNTTGSGHTNLFYSEVHIF